MNSMFDLEVYVFSLGIMQRKKNSRKKFRWMFLKLLLKMKRNQSKLA